MKQRIIFYDTRDGEVFYNTGEIDNPDIEAFFKILEDKYGSRDNIDYMILEEGEYQNEFSSYPSCIVTPEKKLHFFHRDTKYRLGIKTSISDRFWPRFEKLYNLYDDKTNTFNIELMQQFYDDYINFNLRNACKNLNVVWLHPFEMERFNKDNEEYFVLWDNEVFPLKETFANDILEDGMLFPLMVKHIDGTYKIFDGSHRVIACQYSAQNNLWPENRKLMAVEVISTNPKFLNSNVINKRLDNPVVMHIPTLLLDKYSFIEYLSKREYNEYITEVVIDKYMEMILLLRLYVIEMTYILLKYKRINGKTITPSPYINNKEKFEAWINGR